MTTIEQRILKLEQQNPTGAGIITEIRWLIIESSKRCVGALRWKIGGERTEIIGDELEAIKRDYEAKRLPR